jgi:hypothetical protein
VFVAIVGIASLYAWLWRPSEPGALVEISVAGQAGKVFSLSRNQIVTVQGRAGESVLEIRDGRVRFSHSPCREKICIRSGWLSKGGDFAACLPNGVSAYIPGADAYDAINF